MELTILLNLDFNFRRVVNSVLGDPWRLNLICRRFGTLFLFHSSCEQEISCSHTYEDGTDSVPKRRHINFTR